MHLVIFDVDGTLVQSMGVDTRCYSQAVSEHLGTQISTNWAEYRESTDSGILSELYERHGIPPDRRSDVRNAARRRFMRLLSDAFDSDPDCCRQVPGAGALLTRLSDTEGVQIAVATGGWSATAKLKLRHSGISTDGIPFASADDADSREEILAIAHERAAADGLKFRDVTYVGDGTWDVEAAAALGFRFVGMACESGTDSLVSAGVSVIVDHFLDHEEFLRHVCAV